MHWSSHGACSIWNCVAPTRRDVFERSTPERFVGWTLNLCDLSRLDVDQGLRSFAICYVCYESTSSNAVSSFRAAHFGQRRETIAVFFFYRLQTMYRRGSHVAMRVANVPPVFRVSLPCAV